MSDAQTTCPVCGAQVESTAAACPLCGYKFQDVTQAFKMVPVTSEEELAVTEPQSTATLTIKNGRQVGLVYELYGDKVTIGRSPKSDIFLNDMTVSRDHAYIERIQGVWSIKDSDSFNGIWVNNINVDHLVLHDGDIIQIGCFILKYSE